MRMFPVLWGQRSREEKALWEKLGCPKEVPWHILAPHEAQAHKNHSQSLETLARRGGLSPSEMLAILEDRRFRDPYIPDTEAIPRINSLVLMELP